MNRCFSFIHAKHIIFYNLIILCLHFSTYRSWQCGGRMDSIPCSHVGHIFRDTHPYFIPDDSHGKNTMRMAEVWMDDYKRLFYVHRTDLKGKKVSDVSDRLALKKELNV